MSRGKSLLIFPALSAALAAAAFLYVITFHPPADRYPVRGIDVSHHQGRIDWDKVAESGIRFTYIKATEGGDFTDEAFARNWRDAGRTGIARGAYHFFTLCRPGAEQAAHFIATVPKDKTALPPAVDLEFTGNCTGNVRMLDAPVELARFLGRIEAHYGRKAVLYVRPRFHAAYLSGRAIENPLWLQSFLTEPDYAGRRWTFWQYHAFGRVPGIEGFVDRNVFHGSTAEFAAWVSRRTTTRSMGVKTSNGSR